MRPNRAEIGSKLKSIFSLRFLFQLFSIGVIFLFLLSNLFQPNFWSIKTVNAEAGGIGVSFDDNSSYNTNLNTNIINNGTTLAGPLNVELGVYHCNQSSGASCAPDLTPNELASDSNKTAQPYQINVPAPGTSVRTTTAVPSYSCGRVQVDIGWPGHGILGGKVFALGSDCGGGGGGGGQVVCNDSAVTLSASPSTANVGQSINFAISGDASTFINDTFSGGVTNCTGDWNNKTCQASQAGNNFTWTHTWKHCEGSTNNCSGVCTKQINFSVNQQANQCPFGSTQARWQQNINDPWGQSKTVNVGQSALGGGFHNNSGDLAKDVTLTVTGPGTNTTIGNDTAFTPQQAGNYTLTVTTNGQTGGGCADTATLTANAVNNPTCTWTSTQARVQKNLSDPWESAKTINVGDQIRLGGFHNATGQLANASDIALNVTGPMNFSNQGNGSFITPTQAGTFTLTATTPNQSGAACQDTATFTVQAVTPPSNTCTITASPNPCTIATGATTCSSTISWNSNASVDIKVAQTGQQFASSGSGSSSQAANFITQNLFTFNCVDHASSGVLNSVNVTGVAAACTSDNSCSVQMPSACGQVNVGRDNCGNVCIRQSAACPAQGGVNINPTINNNPTFTNSPTNTNTNSNTNTVTIGNVGVGTPAQVLGVTTLPKTGLPELAWSALAFIPAGFGMRKFKGVKKSLEDDPNYIWENRKFKAGS